MNVWSNIQGTDFELENFFIGIFKLTRNFDLDKFTYSSYGIRIDRYGSFSLSNGNGFSKNVKIFYTDLRFLVRTDNRNIDIFIIGETSTIGLDDSKLTAEK